jgi:SAM-dependent methyltransferase
MASTSSTDFQESISRIKWFHRIDVGNGLVTPGDDDSPAKLKRLHFPDNLSGKTVLDIGAWDGFFSFEAENRGAVRVLATDSFVWDGKVPGHSQEGFLTARELLHSKVEELRIEPLDISPATVGIFDVVLLSGVIYHVKHPWLLLERAASVTRDAPDYGDRNRSQADAPSRDCGFQPRRTGGRHNKLVCSEYSSPPDHVVRSRLPWSGRGVETRKGARHNLSSTEIAAVRRVALGIGTTGSMRNPCQEVARRVRKVPRFVRQTC